MNVLEVRDAHKSFGRTQALVGANLALRRGEWLALLGPNGAGKTTLVRAIAGRVRLDAGQVRLFGEALDGPGLGAGGGKPSAAAGGGEPSPAAGGRRPSAGRGETNRASLRRRLGIVPQDFAVYPKLTAAENLHAFGRLQGLAGAQLAERVGWALRWTGLEERARDLAAGFSGGMKRRLNIGCGVLHRPEVILLDEPTVGVDPQSRQRIWEMLDELRRGGASLVLTTHQLDEAQTVCERIVIIDHGRDIATGTLDELIRTTIGPQRKVTVHLDAPPPASLAQAGIEVDGALLRCRVREVSRELIGLLTRVQEAGLAVKDVHVEPPSLHAVFLHLTGRELRE